MFLSTARMIQLQGWEIHKLSMHMNVSESRVSHQQKNVFYHVLLLYHSFPIQWPFGLVQSQGL